MATFEISTVGTTLPSVGILSATIAALNAEIEILTAAQIGFRASPVKVVFESVVSVLCLIRDKMIEDNAFAGLAQQCTRVCHALKTMGKERDWESPTESVQTAIENLERTIQRVKSKVAQYAPSANHLPEQDSGAAEAPPALWKVDLQDILEVFYRVLEPDSSFVSGENKQGTHRPTNAQSILDITAGPLSEPSEPLDSGEQALRRLISGATPQRELAPLIEAVFSSKRAIDRVGRLSESDAQAFIDVVNEALDNFEPNIRADCLKLLYKTCASRELLPSSLRIDLGDSLTGAAQCHGGFGDVWKCEYQGQTVAVKVLRIYENSDLQKISRRFCKEFVGWEALHHPNILPLQGVVMSRTQFGMVSKWMANGNINDFVKAHRDVNRFELLEDVAQGLIYMHEQGMIHGDLKGANILIDEGGHACLADFGLLTIMSDTPGLISSGSSIPGGTCRWMSPELFDPAAFGKKDSRRTIQSDCYALGMVIYEVLSGHIPFPRFEAFAVVAKVSKGERPKRPRGAEKVWFSDDIWNLLEDCWKPSPEERPSVADVLLCLGKASKSWIPPFQQTLAGASATDLSSQNSYSSIDGSTDEDQSSLPRAAPPQQSQKLPLQGVKHDRNSGADTMHPGELDLKGPSAALDRGTPQEQRTAERGQEGLPQPDPTRGRKLPLDAGIFFLFIL